MSSLVRWRFIHFNFSITAYMTNYKLCELSTASQHYLELQTLLLLSCFTADFSETEVIAVATRFENMIVSWSFFYSLPKQFSFWCLHTVVEVLSARNMSLFSQENHRNPAPRGSPSGFMRYLKAQGTFIEYAVGPQIYPAVLKLCLSFCLFSVAVPSWDFWNGTSVIQF